MPTISIIIPIYNAEKTLKRCLHSIILQDFKDFEVILINDCSKDKSYEICDNIVFCDQRFKVKHLPKNNGVSNARNIGLEQATGKYIVFIDSDDYIEKNYLTTLYNVIERFPNSLITSSIYKDLATERIVIGVNDNKIHSINYYSLFKLNLSGYLWNKIYNASIIRKNHLRFQELNACEDVIFNTNYIQYCQSIKLIGSPLYHYVLNTNSITNSYQKDALLLNLKAFSARYPLIEQQHLSDFCDTYFDFFIKLFNNIFDKRCCLPFTQKMKYNQDAMQSPDFKLCVTHLSKKKNKKHILKIIKTYNYYLYWLYQKTYIIKSKFFKQ